MNFFFDYWDASNTEIYNEYDAFFKRLEASGNLETNWKFNCWNLVELDQILSKINEELEELNPNLIFWKRNRVH